MPFYRDDYKSIELSEAFRFVSNKNVITDVRFKETCTLEKVQLLVALCSRLQCLSIKTRMMDLESIVQFLLGRANRNTGYLCSLCFSGATKHWLLELEKLIQIHGLIDDYMLKLIDSKLYLWF